MGRPVRKWNYKTDPANKHHIGPTAQDFQAAFELNGDDDIHISSVDAQGIALAAIQGLNQKMEKKLMARDAEISELKKSLAELKQLFDKRRVGNPE